MKLFGVLLLVLVSNAFAKKNVCTVTINSKEERQSFQRNLSAKDFNFIELTDYSSDKKNKSNDWFDKACEADIQCDVLMISGHFGGGFFGDTGYALGLNDLEKQSCQKRCAGILEKPKEVFLFGCNTLASKEVDFRTPEQYFRALVDHGMDAVEAERIVAARYSPIGSSNGDRMRRVFEGVPMVYGFSSVGSAGKHVKQSLDRYFSDIGDYNKHLNDIEAGYRDSSIFRKNMKAYTTAISNGISKTETAVYGVKENSCKLSDDKIPIEKRLDHAGNILQSAPYTYFPTVSEFVSNHFPQSLLEEPNSTIQKQLIRITARTELKDQVMKIAHAGGLGPALQMDILRFSRTVLWMTGDEYTANVRKLLNSMISKPTLQNADSLCSIYGEYAIKLKWTINDLPANFPFADLHGLKILGCLETEDVRITGEVVKRIKQLDIQKLSTLNKLGVLAGLISMPGYEDEIEEYILSLQPIIDKIELQYRYVFKGFVLSKISGPQQLEYYKAAMAEYAKNEEAMETLRSYFSENTKLTSESRTVLLSEIYRLCLKPNQGYCWVDEEVLKGNMIVLDWIEKYLDLEKNKRFADALFHALVQGSIKIQGPLVDAILNYSNRIDSTTGYAGSILAKAELTGTQYSKIQNIVMDNKTPDNLFKQSLRHAVLVQRPKFPNLSYGSVYGTKYKYECQENVKSEGTACMSHYY